MSHGRWVDKALFPKTVWILEFKCVGDISTPLQTGQWCERALLCLFKFEREEWEGERKRGRAEGEKSEWIITVEEVERLGKEGKERRRENRLFDEMEIWGVVEEGTSGELGGKHVVLSTRSRSTGSYLVVKPEILRHFWFSYMSHAVAQLLLARQSIYTLP